MAALTDARARAITSGKDLADGGVKGLWLKATGKKGKGQWILRYVSPVTKKRRDMGFGTYPEVSIVDAREKANAARRELGRDEDPIDRRKALAASRETAATVMAFERAALTMYEQIKSGWKNPKHAQQWVNTLKTYAFPFIGKRAVNSLEADDFRRVLEPIWLSKSETAMRVKQRCHAVMDWCLARKLINWDPTTVVNKLLPPMEKKNLRTRHQPSMPWKNIPKFVSDILHDGTPGTCREAMEFLILSAARSGEVRKMEWREIDFNKKVWTAPAKNMKAKIEHRVPISWRMMEILRS